MFGLFASKSLIDEKIVFGATEKDLTVWCGCLVKLILDALDLAVAREDKARKLLSIIFEGVHQTCHQEAVNCSHLRRWLAEERLLLQVGLARIEWRSLECLDVVFKWIFFAKNFLLFVHNGRER